MDFIKAFLNNKLNIKLYIKVPKSLYEFSFNSSKILNLLKWYGWDPFKNQVILLGKEFYNLKQASYLW